MDRASWKPLPPASRADYELDFGWDDWASATRYICGACGGLILPGEEKLTYGRRDSIARFLARGELDYDDFDFRECHARHDQCWPGKPLKNRALAHALWKSIHSEVREAGGLPLLGAAERSKATNLYRHRLREALERRSERWPWRRGWWWHSVWEKDKVQGVVGLLVLMGVLVAGRMVWDKLAGSEDNPPTAPATPLPADPFEALGLSYRTFDELAATSGTEVACSWARGYSSEQDGFRDNYEGLMDLFAATHDKSDKEAADLQYAQLQVSFEADRWLDRNWAKC